MADEAFAWIRRKPLRVVCWGSRLMESQQREMSVDRREVVLGTSLILGITVFPTAGKEEHNLLCYWSEDCSHWYIAVMAQSPHLPKGRTG